MTGAQRQDGFILLFALITSIIVLTLATASLAFVRSRVFVFFDK